ncbi:MAG TPA: DUF433 domain-containing protein [Planctomycetaceae bacterium]|nr:DUF433 domain-containing protein [Planctomycetaceae bacterium]
MSTAVEYIELRETRGGEQKAFIAGTRISVQDVYVAHELLGQTPDQIAAAYPHLALAQIHAALTYYYDHADEVRAQFRAEQEFVASVQQQLGPGPLARRLGGNGDSLPSR